MLKKFLGLLPPEFSTHAFGYGCLSVETCPMGEQSERVDIEIDTEKYLIFIEVKIGANEGLGQLSRYLKIAQEKAKTRPWMVVYLTRQSQLPTRHQNQPHLMAISWSQVAKVFLQYHQEAEANNRGAWLVYQFVMTH